MKQHPIAEMTPDIDVPMMDEDESNNVIEISTKSKVSRSSSVTETMGLSGSNKLFLSSSFLIIFYTGAIYFVISLLQTKCRV